MFNNQIWQFPIGYNQPFNLIREMSFAFNWFNLADCGTISLDSSNYDDVTDVDIETFTAPRNDWGGVLGRFVHRKTITVKLVIKKDSEAELNDMIDLIKRKLVKDDWVLRILVNNESRSCLASLSSLIFNRDFSLKNILADVVVTFEVMGSLMTDIPNYVTEIDVASPLVAFDITNESGRTDYKMYIVFKSASWTNLVLITMWGYLLEISHAIASDDILIIDWITASVTLNWSSIDFDWPIVKLEEWSNPISVEINWTYNADITFLYKENKW